MNTVVQHFQVKGSPVSCVRFGFGHINETYLCVCDSGLSYILQKINRHVFHDPLALMENVAAVTAFQAARADDPRESMHLIPTLRGQFAYVDSEGDVWRMYDFVRSSRCLQKARNEQDFSRAGFAFGRFLRQLADFPVQTLHEPIKDFHNTPERFRQFHEALAHDNKHRAGLCKEEIDRVLSYENAAGEIPRMMRQGHLPVRVTHNDTKLNNILFDYDSGAPLCVIDLDTVMPGSVLYDFGDAIRFGASTAAEDEQDLSKVTLSLPLFRAFTEGYLSGCAGSLTKNELEALPLGAKIMTLENAVRFLGDYINGDTYFQIHYESQNLDRARTQLKLLRDMEQKWGEMCRIIRSVANGA